MLILDIEHGTGIVFGIQHFSIHDGPGIRSVVFLKGCPLRCLWCHNPEGIPARPMLSFNAQRCVGCGGCFNACPQKVHGRKDGTHSVDWDKCTGCGDCVASCCGAALEMIGRRVAAADMIAEVLQDRAYHEASGGGMTLSGGEPTGQLDFTLSLLALAKAAGLHCAMETCGYSDFSNYEKLLPLVDVFLYDIKETDPARHRAYTGVANDMILANLRRLHAAGSRIVMRCPIIPGINDRDDHFAAIAALTRELHGLAGTELLPYHKLGTSKTGRMGLDNACIFEEPEDTAVSGWTDRIRELGGVIA